MGLGSAAVPFTGKIDGQGHTVTFQIADSDWAFADPANIGLVGNSDGAEVSHVSFTGSISITTNTDNGNILYIGPAVACGTGAVVSDCDSTVEITATHNSEIANATGSYLYAGGLVGWQTGATVTNCTYEV